MKQDLAAAVALLLAGILAFAGTAKLRRPAMTRQSVAAFGLPTALARPLPFAELGTAALLVASPRLGGIAATLLLAAFTVLVVRTVRRGTTVRCGCFGGADDRPVGPATVVRNTALLLAAAAASTGALTPSRPTLAAIVTATTAAAATSLVVALSALRTDAGTLFPTPTTARRSS